ncbi:hypothetical protein V8C37DRAFT_404493 [Trichoderma ceciliae]
MRPLERPGHPHLIQDQDGSDTRHTGIEWKQPGNQAKGKQDEDTRAKTQQWERGKQACREAKQDSQAVDGWREIGRLSATRSATMQLHVRYGHTHSTTLLDGVWSVGCVSHRLGVVARSKSDGAVASSSTRALLGSIYSRTQGPPR